MKNHRISIAACLIALFAVGCAGGTADPKPALEVNHEAVNLCRKPAGVPYSWQNLQLRNTGMGDLTISDLRMRGDANCAFQAFREPADGEAENALYRVLAEEEASAGFVMTIPPGQTRIVRIDYTPTAPGALDSAALVVTSDGANLAPAEAVTKILVIPICGAGLDPEEEAPDAGADASADPASSCPDCGEPPAAGAPWCGQE